MGSILALLELVRGGSHLPPSHVAVVVGVDVHAGYAQILQPLPAKRALVCAIDVGPSRTEHATHVQVAR